MATRPVPRQPSRRQSGIATMPSVAPFTEQGVVGTVVYSGYIHTREKSAKWTGQQKYMTIADMAVNTSIIAAGVRYTSGLVAHPKWTIRPAIEKDAEAEAAAELVESIINDLTTPWSHVVRRAYMYKFYGFGLQEWTAKRRTDGKIGLLNVAPRPQFTIDRWEVDESGLVAGVWQLSPTTGAPIGIPRSKLLYLVDDALSDSPEGVGVFRHLAEPWERLKMFHDLEARAFERDLRGIPIGRIPYTLINEAVRAGQLTEAKAKDMVKSMEDFVQIAVKQSDTGLTIDSSPYVSQAADGDKVTGTMQWGLELLQGSGGGMNEIASSIKRTQFEMATIMCVQQLLYGMEGSGGNRALSKDMSQNLYLMANAALTDIAAGVDHDIIAPICLLNNIPEDKRPKCEVEDVAFKDAESVAATLAKMAQAGAVLSPDDPVINDVRELMGVSVPLPVSPEMLGVADSVDDGNESEVEDAGDELDAEAEGEGGVEKAGGNPNHKPAGSSEGGQFTSGGGGGGKVYAVGAKLPFSSKREAVAEVRAIRADGGEAKVFMRQQNITHASRGSYASHIGGGDGGASVATSYFVEVLRTPVKKADELIFKAWYDEALEAGLTKAEMLANLDDHEAAVIEKASGEFNESDHPRVPAGSDAGGQFTSGGGIAAPTKTKREIGASLRAKGWLPKDVAALVRQRKYSSGDAAELMLGYNEATTMEKADGPPELAVMEGLREWLVRQ